MEDGRKENIFNINIDSLNDNMREYLLIRLQDVWGKAEKFLKQISVHMALVERVEESDWKKITDAYVYSTYIDGGLKKIKCLTEGEKEETLWQTINERKHGITGNKIVKLKEKIGCGNTGTKYDEKYSDIVTYYDLYWYVENNSEEKSIVAQLVMKLIGDFLVECVGNIVQVAFYEENFLEIAEFQSKYESYNFMNKYVEQIYKEYPELPDKDFCCELSKMPYEKRPCYGKIVLFDEIDFDKITGVKITLKNGSIELNRKRILDVRKMMEVCQKNAYLVAGIKRNPKEDEEEKRFLLGYVYAQEGIKRGMVINFKGVSYWKISINGENVLLYKRDRYSISKEEYFKKHLAELSEVKDLNIKNIERILDKLNAAEHGALMIISQDAGNEAERLCEKYNRGIWLEEFSLEKDENLEMIGGMAAVDGAIMVDFNGNCVAYGVILDGKAKIWGETERGSRYNASKNYVAGEKSIAIVVSEDKEKGMSVENGEKLKDQIIEA